MAKITFIVVITFSIISPFFLKFFFNVFIDFKERQGEGERNKYLVSCLLQALSGNGACNQGMYPDQDQTSYLLVHGTVLNRLSHTAGLRSASFTLPQVLASLPSRASSSAAGEVPSLEL